MSDVQLPIAYDEQFDKYWHVSENIPKSISLVCPFCKHPVSRKAKQIRRHHFFHIAKSQCSPNQETLLHEGSKYYLLNKLQNNEVFRLTFDICNSSDSALIEICKSIGIEQFQISSDRIFINKGYSHISEKNILNLRPDILSTNTYMNKHFAWEIFVSHEIEPNKESKLLSSDIPFIELIPAESGINGYSFSIYKHSGFDIKFESEQLFQKTFDKYHSRLEKLYYEKSFNNIYNKALNRLCNEMLLSLDKLSLFEDIIRTYKEKRNPLLFLDLFTYKFKSNDSRRNYPITGVYVDITACDFDQGKKGHYILFNNKYMIDSPLGMLRSILESLSNNNLIIGYANEHKHIAGITLTLLDRCFQEIYLDIPIEDCHTKIKNIDLSSPIATNSPIGIPYFKIKDKYQSYSLIQHQRLLHDILKTLNDYYLIKLFIQKPVNGNDNYERITGIKVIGLPNKESLIKLMKVSIDNSKKNIIDKLMIKQVNV